MKATEQFFPRVLFTVLYMVVLFFLTVDGISKCDFLTIKQYLPVVYVMVLESYHFQSVLIGLF